ncbi:protealysin inhibitor emfourin [Streptomyces similanensis]|uniref:Metalloprotease n=1 Tax=Streptomyces similanensis TaxID=1274988 RepID=A0ABP9L309_9ACTN
MRIQVRRTGGFAGIERNAEVDTDERSDAQEWRSLAEKVLTAGESAREPVVPDGFSYEITVDGRTIRAADPRLTEDQRELISRVLKEGA